MGSRCTGGVGVKAIIGWTVSLAGIVVMAKAVAMQSGAAEGLLYFGGGLIIWTLMLGISSMVDK
jgi:hypothetical protein